MACGEVDNCTKKITKVTCLHCLKWAAGILPGYTSLGIPMKQTNPKQKARAKGILGAVSPKYYYKGLSHGSV